MNRVLHRIPAMMAAFVLVACSAQSSAGVIPSGPGAAPSRTAADPVGPGSGPDATHPWVMQQTQGGDSTARGTIQPLASAPGKSSREISLTSVRSNDLLTVATRLKREVFAFAFGNASLGDPTYGYPAWSFNLLSTIAYFGLSLAWD